MSDIVANFSKFLIDNNIYQENDFKYKKEIVYLKLKKLMEIIKEPNIINNIEIVKMDNIIKAYGYEIVRFREKDNIMNFLPKLKEIIEKQELIVNPKLFGKFIVEYFVNEGYRKDIIEKLTYEISQDIITGVPFMEIGKTPISIKLEKDIFNWLFIDSIEEKK